MYYADLSSYAYQTSAELPGVLNVGWLDPAHVYTRGHVPLDALQVIRDFCEWGSVHQMRGFHGCPFCGGFDDPALPGCTGRRVLLGSAEIWVPKPGGGYFAAPDLVYHYIQSHGYQPPATFLAALATVASDVNTESRAQKLKEVARSADKYRASELRGHL